MPSPLRILVCSYLEEPLVERIRLKPGVEVLNAPELLPVPRFLCDHVGEVRALDVADLRRWSEMLASADVLFDFDWEQPARLSERATRLRWIQATSSGVGEFVARHRLASIPITTAAGIHAVPLSEWVITGLLHFVKDVPGLEADRAARRWERTAVDSLAGRRALVVGLGSIGRQVAASLSALGVEVWGAGRPGRSYDPSEVRDLSRVGATDALEELLPECDVVVLACPLTPETAGLIGMDELGLLPRGAILVNVARGQVVDEVALIDALVARRLRGAVLDVVASEPLPAESPLWALDNVLICPHSASNAVTENVALVELFLDNLDRFLVGRPLRNVYGPDRGY